MAAETTFLLWTCELLHDDSQKKTIPHIISKLKLLCVKALVAYASLPSTKAASVTHRGCLGREGEVRPAKSCVRMDMMDMMYPFWRWLKPGLWCGTPSCIHSFDPTTSSLAINHLQNKVGKCKVQHASARCAHLDAPTQQSQQGEEGPTRFDDPGHMASLHHVPHFTQKRLTIFLQDAALLHSSRVNKIRRTNSNFKQLPISLSHNWPPFNPKKKSGNMGKQCCKFVTVLKGSIPLIRSHTT